MKETTEQRCAIVVVFGGRAAFHDSLSLSLSLSLYKIFLMAVVVFFFFFFFFPRQIAALDQYDMGSYLGGLMAHVHAELVYRNVECLERLFDGLKSKRLVLWVENNLSQDLCSFLEMAVKNRWSTSRSVAMVKTENSEGRRVPGITTNKKGCLIGHALRALESNVFLARQFSTQARILESKYSLLAEGESAVSRMLERIDDGDGGGGGGGGGGAALPSNDRRRKRAFSLPDISEVLPTEDDRKATLKTLVRQTDKFVYNPKTRHYSGKGGGERDDMLSSLLHGLGWLHSRMNVILDDQLPVPVRCGTWQRFVAAAATAGAGEEYR